MAAPKLGTNSLNGAGGAGREGSGIRLGAILLAVSLVLFTFSCREAGAGPLTAARQMFQTIVAPVRQAGVLVTAPISGLGNIFTNLTADQEDLTQLREENAALRARNAELEEAQQTVQRLQSLLELRDTYSLQATGARIIAGSTDSWSSTVTIDKGTTSGLEVGMPVCDSTGVIGQIIECGPTTSVVRLVNDENSRVSAMVQSTRAQGTLRGSAEGTLTLTTIPLDQTVNVGDIVITSGLGGVYPKGLPIGTITNVESPQGALYYIITVEQIAVAESHEEVIVITSITEGQQATEEDYDEAAAQDAPETDDSDDAETDEADAETTGAEG